MLGMAIIAFAGPSPETARKRRVAMIRGRHSDSAEALLEARMRKAISNRSTGAEAKMLVSLIPNPENLTKRIRMTGKKWTLSQYMTASAGIFLVLSAFLMVRGFPFLMAVMVGMAAALFLPHWWVSRLIKQRINRFNAKFPDALELLTRGLRSGLPIAETLGIVSSEIPGPVGEEFKLIT